MDQIIAHKKNNYLADNQKYNQLLKVLIFLEHKGVTWFTFITLFILVWPSFRIVYLYKLQNTLFDIGIQFLGWVILGTWGRNGFFHLSKFSLFTIFIAIFRFLCKLVNVRFFKLLGTVFHLRIWYLGWENLVQLEIKDF